MPQRFLSGARAIALFVFCCLALAVPLGQTLLFDIAVRDHVHAWASPPLTRAMLAITNLGEPDLLAVIAVGAAAWLAARKRRREALTLVVSTLAAVAVNELLKQFFHRFRPAAFFGYVEPSDYSFPSGHSMISACFYGLLAAMLAPRIQSLRARRALWLVTISLVLAIGFSRIYLGVHYASDVLAGYALGILWVAGARRVGAA